MADDKTSVFARAEDRVSLTFGRFVGLGMQTVAAQAKASVVGKMRLCMLTLDPSAPGAFNLQKNAQVTANGCSLYSNSVSPSGMVGGDNSMAKAETICSSGGYVGLRANFSPTPQDGCPTIQDPLKGRTAPTIGACSPLPFPFSSANPQHISGQNKIDQNVIMGPGTYCGGLHITKTAIVNLTPGIYIIKDGPLIVDSNASIVGTDVSFYLFGDAAGLVFDKNTSVSLSAPTTGPMAGFLMSEDPNVKNPVVPVLDPSNSNCVNCTGNNVPTTPTPRLHSVNRVQCEPTEL